MSKEVSRKYVKLIKEKKIKYIYGYASAIYLLAKYVEEQNLDVNIEACFPTSEILTDLYRETIIRAFKCKIINCYGAHDGGITAFEHNVGCFEVGYNSIVILEDRSLKISSALLTDTFNYAMPLINYKLGDELELDDMNNNLNYNGQVIKQVYGRSSDVIILENGRILTGPGFTVLFKDLPVEGYTIAKVGKNAIKCCIKPTRLYNSEIKKLIEETLKNQVGEGANIIIEKVENFEVSKNGKKTYFMTE
jgi:phenylacetate-CoA ligase